MAHPFTHSLFINLLTASRPEPCNTCAGAGVRPQRLSEFSMVIDTGYNPLSANVRYKLNAACNKPKEMVIDKTADSVVSIQNNNRGHQYRTTPTPSQCPRGNMRLSRPLSPQTLT